MKQKDFIDSHKAVTFLAVALMIAYFDQWDNPTAWVYLAMHGSYGFLWVLKSRLFPDKTWDQETNLWYGMYIWGGLTLYWIAPWLITSLGVQVEPWYMSIAIILYIFGVFFHFTADMQKFVSLSIKPGNLITTSLLSLSRNINYFGEFLIYLSFALLARHWAPLLVILAFVVIVWVPNMRRKEKSLSRYPEFTEYKKKVKSFLPFIY